MVLKYSQKYFRFLRNAVRLYLTSEHMHCIPRWKLQLHTGWCARAPNRRCDHRTNAAQCCALTEPPVRLTNMPVRSSNRLCDHHTMQCAHRTTGAVIEQACALTEPATAQCSALTEPPVRLSNRPVRSPNHRCGYRTGPCAHRTTGAVIEQACAVAPPVR